MGMCCCCASDVAELKPRMDACFLGRRGSGMKFRRTRSQDSSCFTDVSQCTVLPCLFGEPSVQPVPPVRAVPCALVFSHLSSKSLRFRRKFDFFSWAWGPVPSKVVLHLHGINLSSIGRP